MPLVSESDFDSAMQEYSQAAWHHDLIAMSDAYIKLRSLLVGPRASPDEPRTIESLRRELAAICLGGPFSESWRELSDIPEGVALKNNADKFARVNQLRRQIKSLDPSYRGWNTAWDKS